MVIIYVGSVPDIEIKLVGTIYTLENLSESETLDGGELCEEHPST